MRTLPPFAADRLRLISGKGEVHGLRANLRTAATAELAIAYFPGWDVRANGALVPIGPAASTGLIRFALPPGDYTIDAQFTRTTPRWGGEAISLLALLWLLVATRRRHLYPVP